MVLAYNLNVKTSATLNLTMDTVVGIFNGTITWWNDSSILEMNEEFSRIPNEPIRVIVRADDSGSTEIFTSTLSAHRFVHTDNLNSYCDIGLPSALDTYLGHQIQLQYFSKCLLIFSK